MTTNPDRHNHFKRKMWKFPIIVAVVVLFKTTLFFYLWNYLIPDLFHGPELSFLQAMGLLILGKLFVGGGLQKLGGRGAGERFGRSPWKSLSPEDKERLAETMRNRCHRHPSKSE
ncbi:MAG: hypothetical protein EOP10_23295 [Proteobacteria bacterium]|nr:MAG: hypothetical protein EOP10_23295 [Pseudomonadota bacterium]